MVGGRMFPFLVFDHHAAVPLARPRTRMKDDDTGKIMISGEVKRPWRVLGRWSWDD